MYIPDCGCDIERGDKLYEFDGKVYCRGCFESAARQLDADEFAEWFGIVPTIYGEVPPNYDED